MLLTAGATLGGYEIIGSLGAGGMGEVYRGRDSKLTREVAIKVLPHTIAKDSERLIRFEREARLLASLNHPNIATLYSFEQSGDVCFIVMELVEGETLSARLAKRPLPIKEAIPLTHQIAEALESAHEKGIIHRDLKPANIKITEEGKVKVLDFGLAKALTEQVPAADLSQSPTVVQQNTATGIILGTAAYMSPEQARGKPLDKRTDIWSFGCVLYEMLTGRSPFLGETISDIMVRILEREPDWSALPEETPPSIRLLLHRCLQKDIRDRLHDIADARIEIRDASSDSLRVPYPRETQSKPGFRWGNWMLAIFSTIVLLSGIVMWTSPSKKSTEPEVIRFASTLPSGQTMKDVGVFGSAVALSADGRQLVYVAREGHTTRLYRRLMDSFDSVAIPGTEGASAPFLSPDGNWVAFFADGEIGEIKKVSLEGHGLSTICSTGQTHLHGGTWESSQSIVFGHCYIGLERVSVSTGKLELLAGSTRPFLNYPQLLPGGDAILTTTVNNPGDAAVSVRNLSTGRSRTLIEPGSYGRFVPTGHLLYASEGKLLAAPFDTGKLELKGAPVEVLDNVMMEDNGTAHFSFSESGSLVFVPGGLQHQQNTLVQVDRSGSATALSFPPAQLTLRVSPDGRQLLVSRSEIGGAGMDLWIYDQARGIKHRLTDETGIEYWAIWTPDGQRVVYNSHRQNTLHLYWRRADGSGPEEVLVTSEKWLMPHSFSSDGKFLAYQEYDTDANDFDIRVFSIETGQDSAFLQTKWNEFHPTFSPDGRWLAYVSDATGRFEVSVRPYPGPGPEIQLSTSGGMEPIWSPDGQEVYYRSPSGNQVMVTSFLSNESPPQAGRPALLIEGKYFGGVTYGRMYDITPDGKEFIMLRQNEQQAPPTQYNVILNWFEELKRLVPVEPE